MPVEHDPFAQIVNVQWESAATFVIGTRNGSVYYADPSVDEFGKATLPVSGLFPGDWHFFTITGSSYSDTLKVFLICGLSSEASGLGPGTPSFQSYSFICASHDRRRWTRIYKGPQGVSLDHFGNTYPWNSYSHGLVWKPKDKSFYYSMCMDKTTPYVLWSHEQIFVSSNGNSFSGPISDRSTLNSDNAGVFQSHFPADYCAHNAGFDARGQHVPDGIMSTFNQDKDIAMRPKVPPVSSYAGLFGNSYWFLKQSNQIEIVTHNTAGEEEIITRSIKGIEQVTCVAGQGTTWMVGGWNDAGDAGAIAYSVDSGDTWIPGPSVDSGIVTIAWAPIEEEA